MSTLLDTIYGNPWQTDGLNNQQIGAPNAYEMSYRDRSLHTGTLTSIDVYRKADGTQGPTGYADGTGGSIRCRVETDSAGVPSGTLISANANATVTTAANTGVMDRYTFTASISDVLGTLRHLRFTNVDGSPSANFTSINNLNLSDLVPTPLQPAYLDADRAVLVKVGAGSFVLNRDRYLIVAFNYADGFTYGVSYYDALSQSGQREIGSGGRMVRLNFTPTGNVSVVGAHMRVAKRNSSTSAVLVASLIDLTGGGTVLETANIAAASVNIGASAADAGNGYGMRYVSFTFPSRTLLAGRNYSLQLSSTEVTNHYFSFPSRRAAVGDFMATVGPDAFTDGYWEYSTNGTVWNTHSVGTTSQIAQFYFDVTPPVTVQTGRPLGGGGRRVG